MLKRHAVFACELRQTLTYLRETELTVVQLLRQTLTYLRETASTVVHLETGHMPAGKALVALDKEDECCLWLTIAHLNEFDVV
jgi:hypothetical protein